MQTYNLKNYPSRGTKEFGESISYKASESITELKEDVSLLSQSVKLEKVTPFSNAKRTMQNFKEHEKSRTKLDHQRNNNFSVLTPKE